MLLSEDNKQLLWVPPGFAHAFDVTSSEAEFQYKCTCYYNPSDEVSIHWDDPGLAIDWPLVGAGATFVRERCLVMYLEECSKFYKSVNF